MIFRTPGEGKRKNRIRKRLPERTCFRFFAALRLGTCLLFAVFLWNRLLIEASATWLIPSTTPVQFTIVYEDGATKLSGAKFSLYHIGDVNSSRQLVLDSPFSAYPIDLTGAGREEWNTYALTLQSYITGSHLAPTHAGVTGADGRLSFTVAKGVYFILGEDVVISGIRYKTTSFFVFLPEYNAATNQYLYQVAAYPKFTREKPPDGEIEIKVFKKWKDAGHEEERPDKVEVSLLKDGTVMETVALKEENNWRHRFTGLEEGHNYLVVEKQPGRRYRVLIEADGNDFILTNSRVPGKPRVPKEPPGEPPEEPKKWEIPGKGKLPQTGQDWGIVFFLTGTGMLFILLGFGIDIKQRGMARGEMEQGKKEAGKDVGG